MQNHYFDIEHPLRPYMYSLPYTPGSIEPENALRVPLPESRPGFHPAEKNGEWVFVENHQGEEGYINGEKFTIKDYGPYPAGWSTDAPKPTLAEARETKWAQIIAGQAAIMARVKNTYPDDEREGWPFKLPEAEAILAGSDAPMPYIDAEFAGSGDLYSSRMDLARKVSENNSKFKSISGFINGQQTAMYHELERLCSSESASVDDIIAMTVNYTLPE